MWTPDNWIWLHWIIHELRSILMDFGWQEPKYLKPSDLYPFCLTSEQVSSISFKWLWRFSKITHWITASCCWKHRLCGWWFENINANCQCRVKFHFRRGVGTPLPTMQAFPLTTFSQCFSFQGFQPTWFPVDELFGWLSLPSMYISDDFQLFDPR